MKMKSLIFTIALVMIAALGFAADSSYTTKVYKTDGGDREVVADGGVIDIEDGGYVKRLALKVQTIAMAAADYTLTAAEGAANILNITGSPSGGATIVPTPSSATVAVLYTVRNAGSDSGTATVKTSAGTSVSIATGKTAQVWCVSTGCYRSTADATH